MTTSLHLHDRLPFQVADHVVFARDAIGMLYTGVSYRHVLWPSVLDTFCIFCRCRFYFYFYATVFLNYINLLLLLLFIYTINQSILFIFKYVLSYLRVSNDYQVNTRIDLLFTLIFSLFILLTALPIYAMAYQYVSDNSSCVKHTIADVSATIAFGDFLHVCDSH